MVTRAWALLGIMAVVAVAVGMVALLSPSTADASNHITTRSFSADTVAPGGELTVTIDARSLVSGIIIETLPTGFSYVPGSTVTLSDGTAMVDGEFARPQPGNAIAFVTLTTADKWFSYKVTVPTTPRAYTFTGIERTGRVDGDTIIGQTQVTVEAGATDPDPGVEPDPGAPDVTTPNASRAFSADSVSAGGEITVTITAANYGSFATVDETLPAGFSYVEGSVRPTEIVVDRENQTVSFVLLGETSFTYRVNATRQAGDHIFSGQVVGDGAEFRVGGDATVTVSGGDAPNASRSLSGSLVDAGAELTVNITASNYGNSGVVAETLPAGFSYVEGSVTPSTIVAGVVGQTVSFTLSGQTSFSYRVAASSVGGSYSFSGNLVDDGGVEYALAGDTDVMVGAATGPRASRSFSSSAVGRSARITVSITAAEYGAFGVVTETLPEGFTYVAQSVSPSDIVVDPVGQSFSFVLLGEAAFSYQVTASATAGEFKFAGELTDDMPVPMTYPVRGDSSITVRTTTTTPTTGGRRAPEPTRNRAPAFVEGGDASRSVAENSAGGTAVGEPISAKDRDNDKLAYQFRAAVDEFEIDKATGQITVADGANLDFEAKRSYSVTVRVADPDDRTDDISVTINITDVDEEGIIELPAETPELGSELTVSLTDPDGTPMVVSWRWERSSDQVTWTAIEGACLRPTRRATPMRASTCGRLQCIRTSTGLRRNR